jgi:hypothetical protein
VLDYGIVPVALITILVLLPHAATMMQEALQSRPKGTGSLQSLWRAIPIVFIFSVAGGILYVSTLCYLGFGSPPNPELGIMLSAAGRGYMLEVPWMAWWPFTCLALLLLTWVMAGDALLERLGFHSKAVWSKVME